MRLRGPSAYLLVALGYLVLTATLVLSGIPTLVAHPVAFVLAWTFLVACAGSSTRREANPVALGMLAVSEGVLAALLQADALPDLAALVVALAVAGGVIQRCRANSTFHEIARSARRMLNPLAPDRTAPARDPTLPRVWLTATLGAVLVFSVAPRLDIVFADWFFDGAGFPAGQAVLVEPLREAMWDFSIALAILCLGGGAIAAVRQRFLGLDLRRWLFCICLYLLGPGLITNIVLKSHWGRARPATITEFGGTQSFTPALLPTDQCASNCSFVSGEVSGAFATCVVLFVLSARGPAPAIRYGLRIVGVLVALATAMQRVTAGRHFLSDAIFAALIITGLALLLRPILHPTATGKAGRNA